MNKMPYDNWSQVKPLHAEVIWQVKTKIIAEGSVGKITFVFLGQHFKNFFAIMFVLYYLQDQGLLSFKLEYTHVSYNTQKLNTWVT